MGYQLRAGDTVVDESGTNFELAKMIGEGAQGTVFATTAEGVAVKIITSVEGAGRRSSQEERIGRVTRLPVADLPVAAPRFLLRGDVVGYTMTLLTGMCSLSELCFEMGAPFDEHRYVGSGGLLKRMKLVESLAELVATLHGRGLIYCDISTNNVLVSTSPDRSRVFLIDLDNLRPVTDPPTSPIFTAPFAAPENHTGVPSQATDTFALATLAFTVLTGTNPFYGVLLDGISPEQLGATPFAAVAPWIDDPLDDSNRWPHAVPRELTLSPRLRHLFGETFTVGLTETTKRTPAAVLAIAARRARYAVRRCPDCRWDNFIDRTNCASCRLEFVGYQLRLYAEGTTEALPFDLCPVVVLDPREPTDVSAAALGLFENSIVPGVQVHRNEGRWRVELMHESLTFGRNTTSRTESITADEPLVLNRRNRSSLQIRLEPVGGDT